MEWIEKRRLLGDIATCIWLAPQLEMAITRQTKSAPPSQGIGKSTETPLYFNDNASIVKQDLRTALHRIAKSVVCWCRPPEKLCDQYISPMDIRGYAEFIQSSIVRVDNSQLCNDLAEVVDRAIKIIDSPPTIIYLGDCYCGAVLYGNPEDEELECDRCQHLHRPRELRQKNQDRGRDLLVSAADAARFVGEVWGVQLKRNTINQWGRRGKLNRYPTTTEHPLWLLGQIVDLAMAIGKSRPDKSVR